MAAKPTQQKLAKRKSPVRSNGSTITGSTLIRPVRAVADAFERKAVRLTAATALWAFSIFAIIALASYSALDPDFDHATRVAKVNNFGGIVGAYLSGGLLRAFGVAAYLLPLVAAVAGADLAFNGKRTPFYLRGPAVILLLFATAAGVALLTPDATLQSVRASGWIGEILGVDVIRRYFGLGGGVLLLPIVLLAFVGAIGTSAIATVYGGIVAGVLAIKDGATWFAVSSRNAIRHAMQRRRDKSGASAAKLKDRPKPRFVEAEATIDVAPEQKISVPKNVKPPQIEIDKPRTIAPAARAAQRKLVDPDTDFKLPDLDLLDKSRGEKNLVDEKLLRAKAEVLTHKIRQYGIEGSVVAVRPGPVISVYEFKPAAGVKVSRIANLEDDLALATESLSVRIVAPIPGRDVVGIEIPNRDREMVVLREIVESDAFWNKKIILPFALGKDTAGEPVVADIATMPHVLIAGATGSGKSVGVNSLIVSLLYRHSPKDLRLFMIDPKRLELSFYSDIPHLEGHDVVTDPHEAYALLDALVREMEDRYQWMAHGKARNITTYNAAVAEGRIPERNGVAAKPMPFLVCIVDELADLMMVTRKAIEEPIARLAQMARAAGIHLVLATQRPSVDVITGLIKANFPTRIAFKVSSKADARVVLDQQGAENLLGKGDMLFKPPTSDVPIRVHGAFLSEEEVTRVVDFWKEQGQKSGVPEPAVSDQLIQESLERVRGGNAAGGEGAEVGDVDDELFEKAVDAAAREGVVSTSRIQRLLGIGYNRAARIMDVLEARGMVGPPEGAGKPRKFIGAGGGS